MRVLLWCLRYYEEAVIQNSQWEEYASTCVRVLRTAVLRTVLYEMYQIDSANSFHPVLGNIAISADLAKRFGKRK